MSTELEFKVGDVIGIYTITSCAGEDENHEIHWNVITLKGNEGTLSNTRLRKELKQSKLSPEYITSLSGNAYKTLLDEVGEATIQKVLDKKKPAPKVSPEHIQALWDEFYRVYPQANFDANIKILTAGLQALPNPTHTFEDIRSVYEDALSHGRLKVNLAAVGLDKKYGMKIVDNYNDLMRLSANDYSRLAFPTVQQQPHAADSLTAEQVRDINKKQNAGPESPWEVKSREAALKTFFEIHRNIAASAQFEEIKAALVKYVKANPLLPIANVQSYENALSALVANGTINLEPSETDPIQRYRGTTMQFNPPRKHGAPISAHSTNFELVERTKRITAEQISKMTANEYSEALKNPSFAAAIDGTQQG